MCKVIDISPEAAAKRCYLDLYRECFDYVVGILKKQDEEESWRLWQTTEARYRKLQEVEVTRKAYLVAFYRYYALLQLLEMKPKDK